MADLKLLALDTEDLGIVSAHVQDAVAKVADIHFSPASGVMTLVINRFLWEKARKGARSFERCRAILTFKRVRNLRSLGIDRRRGEDVIDLLAISYTPEGEGPEGVITLTLAGNHGLALDVECIEVQLADTGGAWETRSRPDHGVDG